MPPHPTLSSERMDWRTPPEFLDLVRAVRPILYDPATSPDNPTGAHLCAAQGLQDWIEGGIVWMRDGLTVPWSQCVEAYRAGARGTEREEISRGLGFWNTPYGAHLSGPVEPNYRIMRRPSGSPKGTPPVCIGIGRGWAQKWADEVRPDLCARATHEAIALVPVRTDAEWWHTMADASDCYLLWRSPTLGARIAFVDPDTGRACGGSNLASTVFYAGPDPDKFARVFSPHGRICQP